MPKASIAEVIKLASNSGCPKFDSEKFYLGAICPRKHYWGDTGKTLRQYKKPGKFCPCIICEYKAKQEWYQKKEQQKRLEAYQRGEFPKYTIFNTLGYTAFNYSDYPLEVYIRYGINFDAEMHISDKVCKHGHYWLDIQHSLRRNCKPNDCFVCYKIWTMEKIDSGKNAEIRARYYAKHRNVHNQNCLNRYYQNQFDIREFQNQSRQIKRELVDTGKIPLTYEGKPCKNCNKTLRYSKGSDCVLCAKKRARLSALFLKENHSVKITPKQLENYIAKFNSKCGYCCKKLEFDVIKAVAIDHFLPKSKGGANVLGNFIVACQWCNSSKGFKDPKQWFFSQPFSTQEQWAWILGILGKTEENYAENPLV